MDEVKDSVRTIRDAGNEQLVLLHCVSDYPSKKEDSNLRAIQTMKEEFGIPVGYSDHTTDSIASIAAVVFGSKIIEKHITLDKNMAGPDHLSSMPPEELVEFVKSIRNIENSLGDGVKRCLPCELNVKDVARKSLVAKRDIPKGTVLTSDDIGIKRPGTGIPPKFYDSILNHKSKSDLKTDELIDWNDVEKN